MSSTPAIMVSAKVGIEIGSRIFAAFRLPGDEPKPKDSTLTPVEKFLIGTLDLYRNPATHLDNTVEDYARAMELLLVANHQLHLVRSALGRQAP